MLHDISPGECKVHFNGKRIFFQQYHLLEDTWNKLVKCHDREWCHVREPQLLERCLSHEFSFFFQLKRDKNMNVRVKLVDCALSSTFQNYIVI